MRSLKSDFHRKRAWPNGLGFDVVVNCIEVASVFTGKREEIQVVKVEQDGSICGRGVRGFALDRVDEFGVDLHPEDLPGETLLAIVDEFGEDLTD